MEKTKKAFVFNTVWYKIIRNCSTLVKGEVFTAVMEYFESGKIIELSNEASVIFQFIKREIDRREARRLKSDKSTDKQTSVLQSELTNTKAEFSKANKQPSPLTPAPTSDPTKPDSIKNGSPDTSIPTFTPPLTRQMRRKLQRQGIALPQI
ncbi:MAG: hypothetical protein K2K08_02490 [Paramuribaculum sp.]|nr:hypothetical protein [Paramuribaculum sp.]